MLAPCNTVTPPLRSLMPSPVGGRTSEVPRYHHFNYGTKYLHSFDVGTPVFLDKFLAIECKLLLVNISLSCRLQPFGGKAFIIISAFK